MIQIAPKCRIFGIRPELVMGLVILDGVYTAFGSTLHIYHIIDGKHSVGSLHYAGAAADVALPRVYVADVKEAAHKALGPDFDYLVESEHAHLEFQPKNEY